MNRTATIHRETSETKVALSLNLDGTGRAEVDTGIGFFDHMLAHVAKHGLFDLTVRAAGDLHIDAHHTVEDVGIVFGQALKQALGEKTGIRRYGDCTLPMDDSLVTATVDLSGRSYFAWRVDVPNELLGSFASQLGEEFWRAFVNSGALNLHVVGHYGRNTHHILEAVFKAVGRAIRQAVDIDPRVAGIPSTKGVL